MSMQPTVQICSLAILFAFIFQVNGNSTILLKPIQITERRNYKNSINFQSYHIKQQQPRGYMIHGHSEEFVKLPGLTMTFQHTMPVLYKIRFEGTCFSTHSSQIWLYLRLMINDYLFYVDKFVPNAADRYRYFRGDTGNDGIDYVGGLYFYSTSPTVTTCGFSNIVSLNPGFHIIDIGARSGYLMYGAFPVQVIGGILSVEAIQFDTDANIGIPTLNVHKLTSSNAEKRRRRALRLYRQLANNRYKNFITTDESWFYLDGTEGKRKVCYIKKSDPDYDRMILQQDSSRPQGFMLWAGISSYGKTSLRFVKPGVKINSDYYINNILKPFLSRDVPRLFSNKKKNKLIFHQDSAPSHVPKKTIAFSNASTINYVKPEEWMPKSPDAAPMDYSIRGYLKQQLNKQKIESLNVLKKKLLYEWTKMDQAYIDRVLAHWPKRVFLIHKAHGFHVEHRLKL
ncbi:unnamed protein product [Rotaria magnacalcarata]|uniref:Uncharacterized protein n=1 Tax=Rotaria magnacalcarata TaxID=392030 RepID=A0A816MFK7_9BILA|nr:unnamed protein product [Rotaria magnacalcarata]